MRSKSRSEVTYLDHMGSDLSVVNAARVSFGKKKEALDASDIKLIVHLANHQHWTPFAHCMISMHVSVPIFVSRQLVRHTIGVVINEESRRYIDDEPTMYLPESWRSRPNASIKQGSGDLLAPDKNDRAALIALKASQDALDAYEELLSIGVAPEQARMVLPLNMMTQFIWTGSLAAWARICALRLDPHAQSETRDVAQQISSIAGRRFPHSWNALLREANET